MNIFDTIESHLESMGRWQRVGLALLGVGIAWGIFQLLWISPLSEKKKEKEREIERIDRELSKIDLTKLRKTIEKVRLERLSLVDRLEKEKALKRSLEARTRALSFIWFDQGRFLSMLDKILQRSVILGIRLDLIESVNAQGNVTPLIEKKKVVTLQGAGDFASIVKLVHYIESFEALIKVERFDVELNEEGALHFEASFIHYGVAL
jgi:hypothetical protein